MAPRKERERKEREEREEREKARVREEPKILLDGARTGSQPKQTGLTRERREQKRKGDERERERRERGKCFHSSRERQKALGQVFGRAFSISLSLP